MNSAFPSLTRILLAILGAKDESAERPELPCDKIFAGVCPRWSVVWGSVPSCTNSLPAIRDGESQSVKGNWKFKAFAGVCPRVFKNRPCDSWGESYTVPRHLFGKAFARGLSPRAY